MKSFMKKVIMGALALAIVMTGVVSNPIATKAWDLSYSIDVRGDRSLMFELDGGYEYELTAENVKDALPTLLSNNSSINQGKYSAKIRIKSYTESDYAISITSIENPSFANWATADGEFKEFDVSGVRLEKLTIETEFSDVGSSSVNIGSRTFEGCEKLTEFICQSNVKIKTVGSSAFRCCSALKTIDLTEVENIGSTAFESCTSLGKIKFNKVTRIESSAFLGCTSLIEVDFGDGDADTCTIAEDAFTGVGSANGGINNPVLKLPANWPSGDLPGSDGAWHGGYFRYITDISFSDGTLTIIQDEDKQLSVETTPVASENEAVTWTSSDETVATVDANGKVTAVAAGETTITATSKLDGGRKATCTVTVLPKYEITVESGDHGKARADKTEATEGTKVILTAIPDEGYEFDAWISKDVTVTNNKFTMPAKNTIVKAVFKQVEPPEEPESPTPEEPESPTPEDPESPTPEDPESPTPEDPIADQEITIGNLEDLSSVIEAIKSITDNGSTEETPVVTLKMENGVTKVTKEVFEALQENDNAVVIVLDMGNYKWTIDSADITGTPTDIDFSVKIGDEAETIEIDVINEVTGKEEKKSINISLTHSGDFKCKPTLTVNVEEENKGYYANLFYYNPSTKKLEYVCAGRIKPNGDVDLKFPHASDYAIIISDKDMNPDDSAKNESKKSDKKKEEKKDKNKEAVYVDYDTMKSELIAGTVLMFDLNDLTKFKDMKVFTPDKTVMANQKFLADYYAGQMGKKAKILHTYNVHPKSDLQIGESGTKKMFAWNNLAIKTPGAIYAVCYNQKDGAYLLSGTLDNKGTAILPYFIMNEATTVTLFTVE